MPLIFAVGGDVSKGRLDVVIFNQSLTELSGSGSYDDTHAGHVRLRDHIRALEAAHPDAEIRVGVESTGGYERNWLKLFRDERQRGKRIDFWRLNPLAVKRWLDSDLHRAVTDCGAARGIAAFLLARRPQVSDPEPTPHQTLYRLVRSARTDGGVLQQQLQLLLGQVHPELVCWCRSSLPQWLLAVLTLYPTPAKLARANLPRLARIPHVGMERAKTLIANATVSVASLSGPAAELSVSLLLERIRTNDAVCERCSAALIAALADDPRVALLDSITGIGAWTATCLLLELGDVARFDSCRQLIAWAGLDPHDDHSGDGVVRRGISKRGNAYVRALLYMPTCSATVSNPVIRTFYQRLIGRGKSNQKALTAAMAKILRIAYGVLVTGKAFDPDYETQRAQRNLHSRQGAASEAAQPASAQTVAEDLTAPISRREAGRRRARAQHLNEAAPEAPCTGSKSQEATEANRIGNLGVDDRKAIDQAGPRPAGRRHAGAIRPTKAASGGPSQGRSGAAAQRGTARPAAGTGAD